jgi:SOS-response transcriptional repressor LexA
MEATIKKLMIDGPNKYLMPLNPDYRPIKINGNCTIVGVVKKVEFDL